MSFHRLVASTHVFWTEAAMCAGGWRKLGCACERSASVRSPTAESPPPPPSGKPGEAPWNLESREWPDIAAADANRRGDGDQDAVPESSTLDPRRSGGRPEKKISRGVTPEAAPARPAADAI